MQDWVIQNQKQLYLYEIATQVKPVRNDKIVYGIPYIVEMQHQKLK